MLCFALCLTGCATSGRRSAFERDEDAAILQADEGACKPLLGYLELDRDEEKRHSCWNRVWEVPAALVAYPVAGAVLLGAVTAPVWVPLILLKK